jgi:hypothetical protein
VKIVDADGSGMIEFGEFLSIIKGGNSAVSYYRRFVVNYWVCLEERLRRRFSRHILVL